MSHYNFEVKFKHEGCVQEFKDKNPHIAKRIKKWEELRPLEYLISFENKRTFNSVSDIFRDFSIDLKVSDRDLRVRTNKYAIKNKKVYFTSKMFLEENQCIDEESKRQENSTISEEIIKKEEC